MYGLIRLEIHLSCLDHFRMDNTFHTYMCVAYHLITQCGMYFVWGLFWRDNLVHQTFRTFQIGLYTLYIYIYYTGCRKKKTLEEEKVTIKIEGCGAKFYHRNDLGVPDPA